MGHHAGDLLVRQIEGVEPPCTVLEVEPASLIGRESTGAL